MQSPCELSPRFQIIFFIAVCMAVVALGLTAYDGKGGKFSTGKNVLPVQETDQTLARISKNMTLPEQEIPTIATVNDVSALQGSALFEKAEVGDKIVVYVHTGLVILYRPKYDRIVQVAPIYIGSASSSQP